MSAVPRLDATLAWLRERTEEANARLRQSETQNVGNVVQLPLWPEPVRAVPNGFLRSALFGVVKKGARRYVEREQIAAVDGGQYALIKMGWKNTNEEAGVSVPF